MELVPGDNEMIVSERTISSNLVAFVLWAATAAAVADQVTTVDADARYPEGPLWRDGKLFYVEYATSNIKYWDGRPRGLLA